MNRFKIKTVLIKRNFNVNFIEIFKPVNHSKGMMMMNKQLFFICIATVSLYSGAQAAAMDLSILGAGLQPKITELQKKFDPLSIEELQAKLDENAARAKRRSLKPHERSDIALANMVIMQKLEQLGVQMHEDEE